MVSPPLITSRNGHSTVRFPLKRVLCVCVIPKVQDELVACLIERSIVDTQCFRLTSLLEGGTPPKEVSRQCQPGRLTSMSSILSKNIYRGTPIDTAGQGVTTSLVRFCSGGYCIWPLASEAKSSLTLSVFISIGLAYAIHLLRYLATDGARRA